MSSVRSVTFAFRYVDKAGKAHKPNTTAEIPAEEANHLIWSGRARVPDSKATLAEAKKEQ